MVLRVVEGQQALVDILNDNSSLRLECMKYSFSKENPAFLHIADRVLRSYPIV